MTARRQARASARLLEVDGALLQPPTELLDADHPLWSDRDAYLAWMEARGWEITAGDRLGGSTHPHNRRNHASADWAVANSIALTDEYSADWNALRRLGLID